jgi:uncharacterized protein (TIGR02145 family)
MHERLIASYFMKKILHICFIIVGYSAHSQIQQNIYSTEGMVVNPISEIDSIRFNAAGNEMQVVLQNGISETHALNTIDSVTFETISGISLAHTCGADSVHNPAISYGSLTDQEGNIYKTIIIGTQEWMAENLNVQTYRNGDTIITNQDDLTWSNSLSTQVGAWAYYDNDSLNGCPYGKLYNWFAVADARNLCPEGWHVPTDAEWFSLSDAFGGQTLSGGKLKNTESTYWQSPNTGATNESGFSGLPGAYRETSGPFYEIGYVGCWWTSSSMGGSSAWSRELRFASGSLFRSESSKRYGYAVRCVKD